MKILTIIPAKTDSTRLPKKNIQKIKGKTLVEYSIDYAKHSKYNPRIIISSESDIVKDIAEKKKTLQEVLRQDHSVVQIPGERKSEPLVMM